MLYIRKCEIESADGTACPLFGSRLMPHPEKVIIKRIKEEGPVTFERFMEIALYEPGCGYYTSGRNAIGREGDFFTSSHLHHSFGRSIAKQIEQMWEFMGRPEDFRIVEMGPGLGYACRDMLGYLRERDFYGSLQYVLIELSPAVREKQETLLAEFNGKVTWFSSLKEIGRMRGCIFSNELLDAFPVHLVQMDGSLREIYVSVTDGRLHEEPGPLSSAAIARYFGEMNIILEKGYRTEVNLRIRDWLADIACVLREGFILTVDYGYTAREYYSEDRDRGTLLCYHRHQLSEDALVNAGQQDITAHVNFSSLKQWGEELGIRTVGLAGQGAFLMSLGIDEEIRVLDPASGDFPFELARIKRLFMPQGLGDSHSVMIQYKGAGEPVLKGFSLRNRLRYL
jgi:SAM-dependent MidA family methyltransferase